MIESCYQRAKDILSAHKSQLDELASLLIEREVIFTEDVERILGPRPFQTATSAVAQEEPATETSDGLDTETNLLESEKTE